MHGAQILATTMRHLASTTSSLQPRKCRRISSTTEMSGAGRLSTVLIVSPCTISTKFPGFPRARSEEHTSELQSHHDLVCRLQLEKKNHILFSRLRHYQRLL